MRYRLCMNRHVLAALQQGMSDCSDTTHFECCKHLVSVATPHSDDVANPSCCKQLAAIAEAAQAALLQRELGDLLQI